MPAEAIRIIFSPYHVGLRDHRVGNGPHRIRASGLEQQLHSLGITTDLITIAPVDEYEGEIGRSFEIMRRISTATRESISANRFPLILSGNCMSSAAVACGLDKDKKDLSFVYFDAHDDLDSPDVNENGYFDAMGLSMLRGESWKSLMRTVPGFDGGVEFNRRFLYCGLRDQSSLQRQRVIDAGMQAIWGSSEGVKVDFVGELRTRLGEQSYNPALVHLDLDVLDDSYGKVNSYPSPGGMFEDELVECMGLVPRMTGAKSLTVCSFDPDAGDGDRIAGIAVRAITSFVKSLIDARTLARSQI